VAKKKKQVKNTVIKLKLPLEYYKKLKLPNKALLISAKKLTAELERHFKKDKWPLDYGIIVSDIFFEAYGHHLEQYLLHSLAKTKKNYSLVCKSGRVLLARHNGKGTK